MRAASLAVCLMTFAVALASPAQAATYANTLDFTTYGDNSYSAAVSPAACPGETEENRLKFWTTGTVGTHHVRLEPAAGVGVPVGRFELKVAHANVHACTGGVTSFFQHMAAEVSLPALAAGLPGVASTVTLTVRFADFEAFAATTASRTGSCHISIGPTFVAGGPYTPTGCTATAPIPPAGTTYIFHVFAEASAPPAGFALPAAMRLEAGVVLGSAVNTYAGAI